MDGPDIATSSQVQVAQSYIVSANARIAHLDSTNITVHDQNTGIIAKSITRAIASISRIHHQPHSACLATTTAPTSAATADRDAHTIGAVIIGIALPTDAFDTRAVIVSPYTRWRVQADGLSTRTRSRQTIHAVCADLRITP